jgi:hypothetical protein
MLRPDKTNGGFCAPLGTGNYQPLFDPDGKRFWDVELQNVMRAGKLRRFLPRAERRSGTEEILYRQSDGDGRDRLAGSRAMSGKRDIPEIELKDLEMAFEELTAKLDDSRLPPGSRSTINSFKLPNPDLDPDLYRLCREAGKKRLVILWGIESSRGASLPPAEAIAKLRQHAKPAVTQTVENLMKWLFLALLVALLGWLAWNFLGEPKPIFVVPPKSTKSPIEETTLSRYNSLEIGKQVITQQYLRFQLENPSGEVPNGILAWSKEAGTLSCDGESFTCGADERTRFSVNQEKAYRLEWIPLSGSNLHGEFALIVFHAPESDAPSLPKPSLPKPSLPKPSLPKFDVHESKASPPVSTVYGLRISQTAANADDSTIVLQASLTKNRENTNDSAAQNGVTWYRDDEQAGTGPTLSFKVERDTKISATLRYQGMLLKQEGAVTLPKLAPQFQDGGKK